MAVFRMPALPRKVAPSINADFLSGGDSAGVSVQLTGFDALEKLLLLMPRYALDAAGYKASEIAGQIIEDARTNYVPYLDSYLRDSAGWDEYEPSKNMGVARIAMWFGGPMSSGQSSKASAALIHIGAKTPHPERYAADQHETLTYNHPNRGVVTNPQSKYLEKPFLVRVPSILSEIAAAVSEAWGGDTSSSSNPGVDTNTPQVWWDVMNVPVGTHSTPR